MTTRDIVRMTNQIAEFFHPYPHDEALREIANHLRSFWDPRMRDALLKHLKSGGDGLNALALEAAQVLEKDA
ncbi:MAG: formate dehydrogenase subunit delta [Alphaproteobacteria bacterium]|jgi:formate dehydrogenase subunit delta